MRTLRMLSSSVVIALAGLGSACADQKKVLAAGDPPLTQDMVDAYVKLAGWRLGPALARADGRGETHPPPPASGVEVGDRRPRAPRRPLRVHPRHGALRPLRALSPGGGEIRRCGGRTLTRLSGGRLKTAVCPFDERQVGGGI